MLVPVSTRTTNVCSIGFFYVYIVVYWGQFCVNISLYFVCVLSLGCCWLSCQYLPIYPVCAESAVNHQLSN